MRKLPFKGGYLPLGVALAGLLFWSSTLPCQDSFAEDLIKRELRRHKAIESHTAVTHALLAKQTIRELGQEAYNDIVLSAGMRIWIDPAVLCDDCREKVK